MAELFACLQGCGLEPKRLRLVQNTAQSAPKLLLLEARKGGKPGLSVAAPLLLRGPDGGESEELAQIYSAADLFVNPTLEENFPTVNLEALACGTPVITYQTGGSPESITEKCGRVVPYKNYEALKNTISEMKNAKPAMSNASVERAKVYERNDAYQEYVSLYMKVCKGKASQVDHE